MRRILGAVLVAPFLLAIAVQVIKAPLASAIMITALGAFALGLHLLLD